MTNRENQELNDKLMHTFAVLRHQRMRGYSRGDIVADPSQGQGRVIAALKLQDGISTRDLAYVLGLHPASLNETLAKLTQADYIFREQSPEDGRIMLVKLTEKGKSYQQQPSSPLLAALDCLDESEKANFSEYLGRLNQKLHENLGLEEDFAPASFRERGRGHGRGRRGDFEDRHAHEGRRREGEGYGRDDRGEPCGCGENGRRGDRRGQGGRGRRGGPGGRRGPRDFDLD